MSGKDIFQEVTEGVHYLPTLEPGGPFVSGSYVLSGERVYLVETGTQAVASLLLDSLEELGIRKEDVAGAVVTHIHLDHSGGAGWLVQQMPWLKVYVHQKGARHLVDPTRLLASADAVYGGREVVLRHHGEVLPVPEGNVVAVEDAVIDAGDSLRLRLTPSPGHAPHHLLIIEERRGLAFVGELPGHYIPGYDVLYPALAPPGFDYNQTLNSLDELEALGPRALCFSQFGFTDRVTETIDLAREQIYGMDDTLSRMHGEGAGAVEMMRALLDDPLYESFSRLPTTEPLEDLFMSAVAAFIQYYDNRDRKR